MTIFSDYLPTSIIFRAILFIPFLYSCFSSPSLAAVQKEPEYELSLSFVLQESRLIGTAKINIEPNQKLTLFFPELEITGSLLQDKSGREYELLPSQDMLILPSAKTARTLYLSYIKTIHNGFDNLISPKGISLSSNWYPVPEHPMLFHLTATLPNHFTAITEADSFPLKQEGKTVTAVFSKPATNIHFNAGPYIVQKKLVREGLFVYTMFFKEDKELAARYLQAAAAFLNHYEKEIGPFPYNHFVIVANRLPTGYSMPTFTLLGQVVLRLPFIVETSLRHEIVHSWFGNSVGVDYSHGNWCEGLTSFLSDHAYREERGEGVADRLESITKYLSYVHKDSDLSLAGFTSASHNQPMAEAQRAVGYIKGAMLFYELRERIGRLPFREGIRRFYTENKGRLATWGDLQKSFETTSGADLSLFFSERLERSDIPELGVEAIEVEYRDDNPALNFTLIQRSEQPFSLIVPIQIKMMSKTLTIKKEITKQKTQISIPIEQLPLEFTVDPDHAFLRQLSEDEFPAVWSRLLGAEKILVILAKESDREIYQPLLDSLGKRKLPLTTAAEVSNKEMSENNLLFLGLNQVPSRALFGLPDHLKKGFSLDVRHNPLNRNFVAVLISSSGKDQTMAVSRRLSHYGKYSYLEFKNGHNVTKRIESTESGLRFILENLPKGGMTSTVHSFEQIVSQLNQNRVVYVGETHTSLADHLLQLRIIEALYKKNPHLAIGMEMFPASSQQALDRYILSDEIVDERTFLKESDYYNVWRFDYRLFQGIMHFARKNHIPVIGLNLDREIVSNVFRSGGTDNLTREELDSLPKDRNLDMPGYSERLAFMHGVHMQGNHGIGAESGFIQAQGIWDETMAKNIADFLTKRPNYRMVVLAGSQHTRKDSGIPPRVARRIPVQQASVLNIYNDGAPADLDQVADYFFLATPLELPASAKIGIILVTETENGHTYQKIGQFSPHGKAAASGLLEGDIIEEINGYAVSDMADLRIAMLGTKVGETITIKIKRPTDGKDREHLFKVELTGPPDSLAEP